MSWRERFFRTVAAGSLVAALYHALAALGLLSGGGPAWRHALFTVIDAGLAWALVRRPRWLVFPAALLTVQQFTSHGRAAVTQWQAEHTVDWLSIVLLVALTTTVAVLWQERTEQA